MSINTSNLEYGARILTISGSLEILKSYISNKFVDLGGDQSALKFSEITWRNNFGENRGVWTDKTGSLALTYLQAVCKNEDAALLYEAIQHGLKQYKNELDASENALYSNAMADWQANQRKGSIRLGGIVENYENHLKRVPNSPMIPAQPAPTPATNKITDYFSVAAPVSTLPTEIPTSTLPPAAPVSTLPTETPEAAPSVAAAPVAPVSNLPTEIPETAPSVAAAPVAPATPRASAPTTTISPVKPCNYKINAIIPNTLYAEFRKRFNDKLIADRHTHGKSIFVKIIYEANKVRFHNKDYASMITLTCNSNDSPTLFTYVSEILSSFAAGAESVFYKEYAKRNKNSNANGIIETPAARLTRQERIDYNASTLALAAPTVMDAIAAPAPTVARGRSGSASTQGSGASLPSAHGTLSTGPISPDALSQVFDSDNEEPAVAVAASHPAQAALPSTPASSPSVSELDSGDELPVTPPAQLPDDRSPAKWSISAARRLGGNENRVPKTWTEAIAQAQPYRTLPDQEAIAAAQAKREVPSVSGVQSPEREPAAAKRGNFNPSPGRWL